jgi:hypothetical protein
MFRTPPPELAMALAENHRRDLMASARKRSTGGTGGPNPRSFLSLVVASVGRLIRRFDATLAKFHTASKVDGSAAPPWGQRVSPPSAGERSSQAAP